jgi:hypothetical protein
MTSTTVALAVGDALALATAKKLQTQKGQEPTAELFRRFHPGGVIGHNASSSSSSSTHSTPLSLVSQPQQQIGHCTLLSDLATPLSLIPVLTESTRADAFEPHHSLDRTITAINHPSKSAKPWLMTSSIEIIPPTHLYTLFSPSTETRNLISKQTPRPIPPPPPAPISAQDFQTTVFKKRKREGNPTSFRITRDKWHPFPASSTVESVRKEFENWGYGGQPWEVGVIATVGENGEVQGFLEVDELWEVSA